ncbi:MAG: hypothetical protein U1E17_04985 [Geminicoccaceae bacterium]
MPSATCRWPGTRACASWSASCRPTTARAACRTSTGRSAASAISLHYTLGAMIGAQLFRAVREQVPNLMDAIAKGDFAPLLAWLRTHVHGQGSSRASPSWSSRPPAARSRSRPFLDHLRQRYLA